MVCVSNEFGYFNTVFNLNYFARLSRHSCVYTTVVVVWQEKILNHRL